MLVTSEIPGVEPGDLDVSIEGDTLKISGRRREPELPKGERFERRERGVGEFTRVLTLPFRPDTASVEASYERGVLRIQATRAEEDRSRRIEIKSV